MKMISLTINNIPVTAPAGSSILEAAASAGIHIPSLCWHPDHAVKAACRMCMVEVKGRRGLVPSCATAAAEGMEVITESPEIKSVRRMNMELLLSNHPMDCHHCARNNTSKVSDLSKEMCSYCFYCDCVKDGNCELQDLAEELDVTLGDFDWIDRGQKMDNSTPSITKELDKCILCRRCVGACSEVQGVCAWSITGRGNESAILPVLGRPLAESPCVQCGQCVHDCPTGALSAKQEFNKLFRPLDDRKKKVLAYVSSSFIRDFMNLRAYRGKKLTEQNLVAALHRLHIDLVISGADYERQVMTDILADWKEKRAAGISAPLLSVSSFAARKFIEKNFPDLTRQIIGGPSAMARCASYLKDEWAEKEQIDPANIYVVALSGILSDKTEIAEIPDHPVDLVLTPIEMQRMFNRCGADFDLLPPKEYDIPSQGQAVILSSKGKRGLETAAAGLTLATGLSFVREALKGNYELLYLSACDGDGADLTEWQKLL